MRLEGVGAAGRAESLRVALAAVFLVAMVAPARGAGYLYRKQITVDNTRVAGNADLLDFPLLVRLTDPDLRTTANGGKVENANGYDIIFRAADTVSKLDHEVESYDGASGTLVAWVKIPVLDYDDDTRLYIYYGNSGISASQENPTAVWDPDYRAVWHLNEAVTDEATGAVHNDSTANNRDGTQNSNDDIPAMMASGQDFDGTDHINLGTGFPALGTTFTIEGWVWFDGFGSFPTVFARQNFTNLDYRIVHDNSCATGLRVEISYDGTEPGDAEACAPAAPSTGQWYHFAAVKSATELRMHLDGASGPPTATSGTVNNNASNAVRMARRQDNAQALDGRLDEVRVSAVARSSDWILTEYNNQRSPSTFYSVGPQQVLGDCPPLNVTQAAGSFTVAAPDSFEMTFSTATGGSAQTFYDLSLDPSRTYDLAGGVARIEALHTDGLDPGGGFYNTDQNDQGSKLDLLEATLARVRLRQEAFYQEENGANILAGVKGFGDYSVYPSGRMALRWNRRATSPVTYAVEEIDWTVHSTAGPPLDSWVPYSETDGTFPNNPGDDDFTLVQIDTAEVKTDFLNILYQDWTTANGYLATADFTQWWGGGGEEWQIAIWQETTGATLPAGSSEVWNFLTYFKPTNFVNNADSAVLSRRDDYRAPDTLSVATGSGWFDADENTASDFYNESEGAYLVTCDPGAGLTFDIDGASPTRHHPFFKIRQWRSLQDPASVTLEGVPLTNDSSYKADVKPVSRAHLAREITWSSTLQSAAAVTSPDVGSAGTVGGTTDFPAGRFGNGARFDADGEYLSFPPSGNFNPAEGAIEFWYRPFYDYGGGDPFDDYGLFGYWIDADNYFYAFHEPICGGCDGSDEGIKFIIVSGGVLFYKVVQAPPFTPVYWRANEWVHLRFVWDSLPQRLEVYINGTAVGPAATGSYPTPVGLDTAFYIGDRERDNLFANNANGVIDEFRIYNSSDAPTGLAYGGLSTHPEEYLADGGRNFSLVFAPLDGSGRGRYAYFGADSKFRGLNVALATTGAGTSPDLQWQYWNGTGWANLESFGFVDQTNNFTEPAGTIYWTSDPTNWSLYSINGGPDLYYVRAYLASGDYATQAPIEGLIKTDILLFQYCGDITANAQTFAFGLPPPTAVELVSFSARGWDGGVELSWETASELDNLGFQLYRSTSERGRYERITIGLIPGLGSSASGKVYRYLDTAVANDTTYYYRLEDVEASGKRTLHGPVSARPEARAPSEPASEAGGSELLEVYGDAQRVSFRVLRSDHRGVDLELVTGGFTAERRADGSVRLFAAGFAEEYESGAPAVPVKRAWLEVLAGRQLRIGSVRATDILAFTGLRPTAADLPELVASSRGTVRAGSRRSAEAASFQRPGLYPEETARLLGEGFQGDVKKAWVELAPLRWDRDRGRLLLARRLVVRLLYAGRDSSERTLGGVRGRRPAVAERRDSRPVVARLRVKEAGLYRLGFDEVFAGARSVETARLRLSRHGKAVAFHVEPRQDVFGRDSTLFFVSEGASLNPYGREAVYELELGENASRMPARAAAGAGETVGFAWAKLPREENRYYQAGLLEADDLWQWDVLMAPVRKTYEFVLRGLQTSVEPARLSLWLQGASDFETRRDHRVRAYVNGAHLGEITWDGKKPARLAVEVPPGLLREGVNALDIENVGDTGAAYSMVFLDRYEVIYPRRLEAEGETFEGSFNRTGVAEVAVSGGARYLLEVTGPEPIWLTGWTWGNGKARFAVEAGRRYLLAGAAAVRSPEVSRVAATRLLSPKNSAEYLVLGPRRLLDAAGPLVELRRSQGLRVKAVPVEDIYAEFGYGEETPEAVRELVAYAYHHWAAPSLKYVLLVGDASYDFKDYLAAGAGNAVPPLMVKTSYLWTASDPAYASVNGDDGLPDVAIGRLPARTPDEVRTVVEKIVAYEENPVGLEGPVVLVADDSDPAGDFEANAEELAATVLAGRTARRVYLGRLGTEATRNAVRQALDDGAGLLSYVGHGGIHLWAQENIFSTAEVARLAPQSQQPVVLTLNCLNGYFHFPYFDALAEALLRAEGKGAIAVFSPSGLSVNQAAHVFHKALVRELIGGRHPRLGDAVLAAQSAYAATGVFPELLRIYHVFGDPALRLR